MDAEAKKTVLRMIPYGLYILTSKNEAGEIGAATVSWVTQASFQPPLVAIGVKADSSSHGIIKESGLFALNMLRDGQGDIASTFIKETQVDGGTISGEPYHPGSTGVPILDNAQGVLECRLVNTIEKGDHSVFVGEIVEASLSEGIEGRPDEAVLRVKSLGEKVFYGG